MQIKMKNERPTFKPVTLEITFETAEELEMYSNIMSYNTKIPSIIYCNGTDEFYAAQSMMAEIHEIVRMAKEGN